MSGRDDARAHGEKDHAVHGTTVALALDAESALFGMILLGPSGCGKTALALTLMERCRYDRTVLVADDMTLFRRGTGGLVARPPVPLRGLAELRECALVPVPHADRHPVEAALDLSPSTERLPARDRRWSPFPDGGPDVPLFPAPPHRSGLVFLARAVRAGHLPEGEAQCGETMKPREVR